MPELGKATYFLVADTRQFDSAFVHADEVSAASSTAISGNIDRVGASMARLNTAMGANTATFTAGEAGQVAAAEGASTKIVAAEDRKLAATKFASHATMAALAEVAAVLYEGTKEMKEQKAAASRLDTAYANLSSKISISRKSLDKAIDSMVKHSTYSKGAVMDLAAYALRLQDVGDKARFMQLVVDSAATSGKEIGVVMKAWGRAFESAGSGLAALGKAGINFTAAQKAQAMAIYKTSGAMAYQAFVFKTAEKVTAGAAQRAADRQPWIMLWKSFKEVSASIVSFLVPGFQLLTKIVTGFKPLLYGLVITMTALSVVFIGMKINAFVKGLELAAKAEKALAIMQGILNAVMAINPFILIAAGIAILVVIILKLTHHMPSLAKMWKVTMVGMKTGLVAVVEYIKLGVHTMLEIFTLGIRGVLKIASHIPFVGGKAKAALKEINTVLDKTKPDFAKVGKTWHDGMQKAGKSAADGAATGLKAGAPKFVSEAQKMVNKAGQAIRDGLKTGVTDAMAAMQVAMKSGAPADVLKGLQQNVNDAIGDKAMGVAGGTAQHRAYLEQMAQDVKDKLDKMRQTASDKMTALTDTIKTKLLGARDSMKTAFTALTDVMFRAFDAVTDKNLEKLDRALDKFNSKIDAQLAKVNSELDKRGAALTPNEQKLKDFQDLRAEQARQKALQDAQLAMAQAKTPEEAMSAAKAIQDAQDAIYEHGLQIQADGERKALDAKITAQKDAAAKQAAAIKDAYAARIKQAKLDYASERELYKQHLQKWLNAELAWLQKHPQAWKHELGKMMKVFGPDVAASAKLIGRGFVGQFADAVANASKRSLQLTAALGYATHRFGAALANGIILGMSGLGNGLYRKIVGEINTAFKNLGIHFVIKSPSKYTADKLGKPLGQGIVVGFADAVAKLAHPFDIAIPTMRAGYSGGSAFFPGTAGPTAMGGTARHTPDGGNRHVTIEQHITRTDPDPMQLLQEAKHAADGVFGY